jgi:hypothetical protein
MSSSSHCEGCPAHWVSHLIAELHPAGFSIPRRILAAPTVLAINIAIVSKPTPPGTGV